MKKQPECSRAACNHRQAGAWRVAALFTTVFGLAILLAGCTQHGPGLVKAGRNDYNKALKQTEEEEQLLNLVRLRYADSPMMLDVNSVSTSFTWSNSASAEAFKFEPDSVDSNAGVRGQIGYLEKPTVTYTPLGGKDFVENMLTPLDINSMLLLSSSGWSVERLLRVTANSMSGLSNAAKASGPTPDDAPEYEDFIRAAKLIQVLQEHDVIIAGYRDAEGKPLPAFRTKHSSIASNEVRELYTLLGLQPGEEIITLDIHGQYQRPDRIGLELRSLIGMMFFLSHAVEIPQQDLDAGRVMVTRDGDDQPFDWSRVTGDLFVVKSQAEPPDNAAVAIQYRNNWFYIDDSDMTSKYTFMLLGTLTALQSGHIKRAGPLLTLPVTAQ